MPDNKSVADATHICMLLDRTGSMSSVADDTIGGVNTFLAQQRAAPGTCTFTLIQFDSENSHEVVADFVSVSDAKDLTSETFVPRAYTPLYDALCKAVAATEAKLKTMAEPPGKVVFVVVTDGGENASTECKKADAVAAVQRCEAKGWEIVYLGVGIDGMADGGAIGVKAATTLNVGKSSGGIAGAFACTAANLCAYRSSGAQGPMGAPGDPGTLGYTGTDRAAQVKHGAVKSQV